MSAMTALRDTCAEVARNFAAGERMIDSSPMYGSSQEVIGYGLSKLTAATSSRVFSADKVWISPGARGRRRSSIASAIERARRPSASS